MEKFNILLIFASLQAILVGTYQFFAFIFEEVNLSKIILEQYSIIYAGVFSGGIAFTLQMYAQKNIDEAPAAIIYSLEGVFAAVAGWIILNQILDLNNIRMFSYFVRSFIISACTIFEEIICKQLKIII